MYYLFVLTLSLMFQGSRNRDIILCSSVPQLSTQMLCEFLKHCTWSAAFIKSVAMSHTVVTAALCSLKYDIYMTIYSDWRVLVEKNRSNRAFLQLEFTGTQFWHLPGRRHCHSKRMRALPNCSSGAQWVEDGSETNRVPQNEINKAITRPNG